MSDHHGAARRRLARALRRVGARCGDVVVRRDVGHVNDVTIVSANPDAQDGLPCARGEKGAPITVKSRSTMGCTSTTVSRSAAGATCAKQE